MAKETKDARTAETAERKAEAVQEQVSGKAQKAPRESAYPVAELAAGAKKVFGVRQECVLAALKAAGKPEYTVAEAKEIVERFLKREVD